ncbi:hypothetical protein [Methylosarcina fibrata]|uniref:hypothetical protein n=1 Tax=Methylosarcina fibrata TaxID=105972 RepID=UPI00037415FE|nr:hypothetical protein [Methylosarcina fibrata]
MSIKTRLDKLEGGNNGLTLIVVRPDETEAEAMQRYQEETGRNPTGRVLLIETGVSDPET